MKPYLKFSNFQSQGLRHFLKAMLLTAPIFFISACIEDKVEPVFLGAIHGVVVNKTSQEPIADAEITTAPVTSTIYTNESGEFEINYVAEGEYTIIVDADNYSRQTANISVVREATTTVSFKLSSSNILAPIAEGPDPADGALDQPLSGTLRWTVDNPNADYLEFNFRIYEAGSITPFIEKEQLADTFLVMQNLNYNTVYYWQVDAVSSSGYVTVGDMWNFKTIPFPNNRIVFVSNKDNNYEIYSTSETGDSQVRVTTTDHYEFKPIYSNTRNQIAFSSNANVDYHIYTVNPDGTNVKQITTIPIAGYHNNGLGFSWSPDNGTFIYSHYDKLYRIGRTGSSLTHIATAPANRHFRASDWTAINNKIVVETVGAAVYTSEIYIMNANGSDTVRLVDDLPGIMGSPSFSVDGTKVMFTQDISGYESADGRQLDTHIFIIDIETREMEDISVRKANGTNDLQPRFSPTGAQIIFVNADNDNSGNKSIWIMDVNGENRQQLIQSGEYPDWQ